MLARRVDGLIIGDAHLDGGLLQELTDRKVPFVLMNRRVTGYPSATCDDVVGGELVASHLWEMGHRQVAVIAGEPYASTAVDRTAGFLDRWRSLGGTISDDDVVWSRFDTAGGREAGEKILASGRPRPTAIFAVNDFAAIGAMGALRARGLTVGQDVAVVGYNDTSLAAELPIPLTSVHSPMADIGRTAVQLIQAVLRGEKPDPVQLEPTLYVRESSAARAAAEMAANSVSVIQGSRTRCRRRRSAVPAGRWPALRRQRGQPAEAPQSCATCMSGCCGG
jgi:LacI family transcriptional regulator